MIDGWYKFMNPGDLLSLNIEKFMIQPLKEKEFKYSKSTLKFSRKRQDFDLSFSFSLNRWNKDDECNFWTMWSVTSIKLSKWYQEQWGTKPNNNAIVGAADWNIPSWSRGSEGFTLVNTRNDDEESKEFMKNVLEVSIPFFEGIRDWTTAAEFAAKAEIVMYARVCDLYLIADQSDNAKDVLYRGKEDLTQLGNDQLFQLPEIEKRLNKYFR